MKFKEGDRVRVKDKGWIGTISDINEDGILIKFDNPVPAANVEDPEAESIIARYVYVPEQWLEHFEATNPEWESLWESATKKDDK